MAHCLNFICLMATMMATLVMGNDQHVPALILKQAADQLMAAPFGKSEPQYQHGPSRVEVPSAQDLLIRRLQGELALRVEDNWLSLNDPQRWAIMQTKDPARQILKSFVQIKTSSARLEEAVNVEGLERALNGLQLEGEARDEWVPFWETVRREVGKIAQFYNYFKGYIEREDISGDSLLDFATSVTTASPSLSSMLQSLHQTVQPTDTSKHLFPFLHKLLEVTMTMIMSCLRNDSLNRTPVSSSSEHLEIHNLMSGTLTWFSQGSIEILVKVFLGISVMNMKHILGLQKHLEENGRALGMK